LDPSIGQRIRARRQLRRWSIRYAADRAGIAHTTWSRIERGALRTDRYMIADLAAALECAVTDLTGQPYTPADRHLEAAQIAAERVWQTMMAYPLSEPTAGELMPEEELRERAELVAARYAVCDYAAVLGLAVDLVPALHSAKGRAEALEFAVRVYGSTMGSLLNIGYPGYAWLAAERCAEVAEHRELAVPRAVAAVNRARVLAGAGAYGPARRMVDRAAADVELDLAEPAALDLLGFTHVVRAHHHAGLHQLDTARYHLAEAERIAARPDPSRCSRCRTWICCSKWLRSGK
jgi:transcriptional regulator with XRE-family HTH domain